MSPPTPEWRTLFELWRNRSFELAIPLEFLSPDSRPLIAAAGALCHAIVMGKVRSDIAPECASLLDVARGWAAPATPLQRAWLEYQDLCLSHACRLLADAEQELRAAQARLCAAEERERRLVSRAALLEMTRKFDVTIAAAAKAEQELPQVISDIKAKRSQVLSRVDEELNVARESLHRLEKQLADANSAFEDAHHKYKELIEKLIYRPARKLGTAVPNEVKDLLQQRLAAESECLILQSVVNDLVAQVDHERKRYEHVLANRCAEETWFDERIAEAQNHARQLRRDAEGLRAEIAAQREYPPHRVAHEVQQAAHAVEVAQKRVADLSPNLMPLRQVAGIHPCKRESFVYLHLCSKRPHSAHHFSSPSTLDGFEPSGTGLWTIRGRPCHKEALQLAFPEAVQTERESPEDADVILWTLDARQVPARDRERIEPLLRAMRSVLCCSTSLDAYFALDWYKTHDKATGEWHNTEVGEMVFQAKYRGRHELVDALAARLSMFIRVHPLYSRARLLAAVPCLASKQYDVPRHLCAAVAALVNKVDATGALHKVRETRPMKDIDDPSEKLANVKQAFRADALSIAGDDVVIMDDTYGSGATLWEAARALREAGARRVLGLTCTKNWRSR